MKNFRPGICSGNLTTCLKVLQKWENRGPRLLYFQKKGAHKIFKFWLFEVQKSYFHSKNRSLWHIFARGYQLGLAGPPAACLVWSPKWAYCPWHIFQKNLIFSSLCGTFSHKCSFSLVYVAHLGRDFSDEPVRAPNSGLNG